MRKSLSLTSPWLDSGTSAHRMSGFFQGTDLTMLQKLNSVHANNKAFLQPKNIHDARFGIAHFAGEVYYQAEGGCSSPLMPLPNLDRVPGRPWKAGSEDEAILQL